VFAQQFIDQTSTRFPVQAEYTNYIAVGDIDGDGDRNEAARSTHRCAARLSEDSLEPAGYGEVPAAPTRSGKGLLSATRIRDRSRHDRFGCSVRSHRVLKATPTESKEVR